MLRLYNIPNGKIFFVIAGEDINNIPLSTLRHNIGFVTQDPFLFSTTMAENINLAFEDLDMEESL